VVQRSQEEAREVLLDAALVLFIEHFKKEKAVGAALDAVAFPEVAEQAGYRGPGMIYHLWRDEEGDRRAARNNFQHDLMQRIIDRGTETPGVDPAAVMAMVEGGAPLDVIAHAVTTASWFELKGTDVKLLYDMLLLFRHDAEVRAKFAPIEEQAIRQLAEIIDGLVTVRGMKFRSGLSALHLLMLIRSMADGLVALSELCPDIVDVDHVDRRGIDDDSTVEGSWSLYSIAVDGLIRGFLEPAEPAG